ncbi:MAG: sugar phosphate isomerase/epimerase [Bacteroidetes bacterium]|nr:sugar phosphate isomerase/epimerase [Bacteroidota bacterium]
MEKHLFEEEKTESTAESRSMPRRDFLQLSGLGLLGAMLPMKGMLSPAEPANQARLSMQLYTVRDAIDKDPAGTLKRVADIGFKWIETAFWPPNITLQQAAKYIRDAGLSVSSSHIELPTDSAKKKTLLDTAKAYNSKKMIWHGWPEDKRYSSLEGTKELARIYNESHQFAKDNGLQFGLHNHWWEYRNKVGGKFVYEVLLEEVNPDIFFEVDTYWVKVAGQNPSEIVAKLGKRAKMLHIKDGPARWNDQLPKDIVEPMTPVGQGTQNFPAIVKAANGNTEWMVVEMDKVSGDVFEALKESYDYLVKNKMVRVG